MKFEAKWLPIVSLALGLPATILITAVGLWELVAKEIISQNIALILFLAVVTHMILLMVYYALKRKN